MHVLSNTKLSANLSHRHTIPDDTSMHACPAGIRPHAHTAALFLQLPHLPLRGDTAANRCSDEGQELDSSMGSVGPLHSSSSSRRTSAHCAHIVRLVLADQHHTGCTARSMLLYSSHCTRKKP